MAVSERLGDHRRGREGLLRRCGLAWLVSAISWCLFKTIPAGLRASGCLCVALAQLQVTSAKDVREMLRQRVVVVRGRVAMVLRVDARFGYRMRRVLAQTCAMRISVQEAL